MTLQQEAERSSEMQEATYTPQHKITYQHGFVDGANSKYVQRQKIEFAMQMLNRAKDLDLKTVYSDLEKQLKP